MRLVEIKIGIVEFIDNPKGGAWRISDVTSAFVNPEHVTDVRPSAEMPDVACRVLFSKWRVLAVGDARTVAKRLAGPGLELLPNGGSSDV